MLSADYGGHTELNFQLVADGNPQLQASHNNDRSGTTQFSSGNLGKFEMKSFVISPEALLPQEAASP